MSLTSSLNNAVSGLNVGSRALDIVSRNVANAGKPGYHRQSLQVIEQYGQSSSLARPTGVQRAFSESLQHYYTRQVSDAAAANIEASYLDRLQVFLGKPGAAGSLDSVFAQFQNGMQALATSPDDPVVRAQTVSQAQALAETLNRLTATVQGMRVEAEGQMGARVDALNTTLASLDEVNRRIVAQHSDSAAQAQLADERDRLVASIAEQVDVKATYRPDGSVSLATRSGISILDGSAGRFEFSPAGGLSGSARIDAAGPGVGVLTLRTPSGVSVDLGSRDVITGGELGGLLALRDRHLVLVQDQLDQIAAGLAQAFSTVHTKGTAVGAGFELDLSQIAPGNDFLLDFSRGGVAQTVRVVNVEVPETPPRQYRDANGATVVELSFAGGAQGVAAALGAIVGPGLTVAETGGRLSVQPGAGNVAVTGLTGRHTATGVYGQAALPLFVDHGGTPFTGRQGEVPQILGFAGRIAVNLQVLEDDRVLVQATPGAPLGDAGRATALLGQLRDMQFAQPQGRAGAVALSGTVEQLIAKTMTHQGAQIAGTMERRDNQLLMLDAISMQMGSEYGVDVDAEMARLLELQSAYAANARVISVVQELMKALLAL